MSGQKLLSLAALGLALGLAHLTPAHAAPAGNGTLALGQSAGVDKATTEVRYRGRRFGRGVGVGLGIGVLGAIIADQAYRPRTGYYYDDEAYDGPYYYPSQYSGDPRRVCAQNFRSFEWNTGLYTTYSGEKRLCPYLR
jgi:hypothetical protein